MKWAYAIGLEGRLYSVLNQSLGPFHVLECSYSLRQKHFYCMFIFYDYLTMSFRDRGAEWIIAKGWVLTTEVVVPLATLDVSLLLQMNFVVQLPSFFFCILDSDCFKDIRQNAIKGSLRTLLLKLCCKLNFIKCHKNNFSVSVPLPPSLLPFLPLSVTLPLKWIVCKI